jgi:hypothetical protein
MKAVGWGWITVGLLSLAACGVGDRKVDVRDKPDGNAAGGGGGAGSGGRASSGGGGSSSGGAASGGEAASGGSPDAGTGGTGTGGTDGTGGAAAGGTDGGTGGSGAATCTPACEEAKPVCDEGTCVVCLEGRGRCQGSTPQSCTSGAWVSGTPCSGDKPICAGEGQCTGTRLVGGIVTTAGTTGGTSRLRSGGLEVQPRVCAGNVCVSGGIRP